MVAPTMVTSCPDRGATFSDTTECSAPVSTVKLTVWPPTFTWTMGSWGQGGWSWSFLVKIYCYQADLVGLQWFCIIADGSSRSSWFSLLIVGALNVPVHRLLAGGTVVPSQGPFPSWFLVPRCFCLGASGRTDCFKEAARRASTLFILPFSFLLVKSGFTKTLLAISINSVGFFPANPCNF